MHYHYGEYAIEVGFSNNRKSIDIVATNNDISTLIQKSRKISILPYI
ncbi:hypothetical protein [Ureibacillus xyleni]|nr:hypothetical protein [Ureibacillus xyleni]